MLKISLLQEKSLVDDWVQDPWDESCAQSLVTDCKTFAYHKGKDSQEAWTFYS